MILVIGYGNRLRGDDGVGLAVAEKVEQTMPGVTVLLRQQLVPEMAEEISAASTVIFVDARDGNEPGRVRCARVRRHPPAALFGHAQGPEALLALAADLFEHEPDAFVVTVDVARTDLGTDLSPVVAEAVPTACEVIRMLARLSSRAESLRRTIAARPRLARVS